MRHSLGCLLLVLFVSLYAWAGPPIITGVTGASGFTPAGTVQGSITTTSPVVYGGLAGSDCTGDDGVNTCNNCASAQMSCATKPYCTCNTGRIYDSLTMQITINGTSAAGNSGVPNANLYLVNNVAGNTQPIPLPSGVSLSSTAVSAKWQSICQQIGAATVNTGPQSCESVTVSTNNTVTLNLFFDTNANGVYDSGEPTTQVQFQIIKPGTNYDVYGTASNASGSLDGIGSFLPYPGDSEVYLEKVQAASNFPSMTYGGTGSTVRVYAASTNMGDANVDSSVHTQDLPVTPGGASLQDNLVTGLNNGTPYYFRIAIVDQAGNATQFFPDQQYLLQNFPQCTTAPDAATCPFAATPDQVLGILNKDLNCFVATAAYGSALDPRIQVFRDFRHEFLLRNKFGLKLVQAYYRYGPHAAHFIVDKPALRAGARLVLWPLYGFSYLALKAGFSTAAACAFLIFFFLVGIPWYWLRNKRTA